MDDSDVLTHGLKHLVDVSLLLCGSCLDRFVLSVKRDIGRFGRRPEHG